MMRLRNMPSTLMALAMVLLHASPVEAAPDVSAGQWYVNSLNLDAAQAISTGEGARVALLDTGIDALHPALRGSIEAGINTIGGSDDHGLFDANGHGTSLAGLIVGHGIIRGVAPKARVYAINNGSGLEIAATNGDAEALDWVVAHGINIVCIASNGAPDARLAEAVKRAVAADVVVVAAAGNKPTDSGVVYPASAPGVLAVGGIGKDGNLSSVSVSGADISLVAPADHISVAHPKNTYTVTTGTSNSSAIVAGAVALIRGKYPKLSALQVISALTSTAIDGGQPGRDFDYGYGRIDIVAALKKAGTLKPDSSTSPTVTSATVTATSPEPKSGLPTTTLVAIVIGGLLAAALVVLLIVGLTRRI